MISNFFEFFMDPKILAVIQELEQPEMMKRYWNVPQTTAQFLHLLVKMVHAQTVLEIGTSNGYSGLYFADALLHTGGTLYTVESHKGRFLLAEENFKKAGVQKNVRQVLGHAPEVLQTLKNEQGEMLLFDFIFLDATKNEYKSHFEAIYPFLDKEGVIVADNVISHGVQMKSFLDMMNDFPGVENALLSFDNGLLLSWKKE